MPDNEELAREVRILRKKIRAGEDKALTERRRQQELSAAYGEARSQSRATRGF